MQVDRRTFLSAIGASAALLAIGGRARGEKKIHYVGNRKSKKFHKSNARCLIRCTVNCTVNFKTKQEAVQKGYMACKKCKP